MASWLLSSEPQQGSASAVNVEVMPSVIRMAPTNRWRPRLVGRGLSKSFGARAAAKSHDGIDIDAGPVARVLIGIVPQAITLFSTAPRASGRNIDE